MRWIWIDKFIAFESGKRAVSLKNVTMAEEHLHDFVPGFPIMPECLIIEAMAQTSGILVGEAGQFKEKVVLAKINKAHFHDFVRPGDTLHLHATLESFAPEAASTSGFITRGEDRIADINLMFSHVDQNLAGLEFPEENFVFEDNTFKSLLRDFVSSGDTGVAGPAE